MKLLKKDFVKVNEYAKQIRNGIVHAQGTKNKRHGKALEMFLAEHFNLVDENGNPYDQFGAKVDFPKEVVERGNVPQEWVADWEVKYYNKNSTTIFLGDAERKMSSMKNGLVLVVGLYDGSPENIVDIQFIKIQNKRNIVSHFRAWKEASKYVKDRGNTIEETKQFVKRINNQVNSYLFLANTSRQERYSNSKGKWENEARAVQLCVYSKNLSQLA